jgi:hypothetical protein
MATTATNFKYQISHNLPQFSTGLHFTSLCSSFSKIMIYLLSNALQEQMPFILITGLFLFVLKVTPIICSSITQHSSFCLIFFAHFLNFSFFLIHHFFLLDHLFSCFNFLFAYISKFYLSLKIVVFMIKLFFSFNTPLWILGL